MAISNVAIVGAGPVGLACLKFLLAENHFHNIDVFEQNAFVGGIWKLTGVADRTKHLPVPQEDPSYGSARAHTPGLSSISGQHENRHDHQASDFESPLYDELEANIPKVSMQYSDLSFPDDCPLYPNHEEVLVYIEQYAKDVKQMIKFETKVLEIVLSDKGPGPLEARWEITTQDLRSAKVSKARYDAVIIASGHYEVPKIVGVSGMSEWNDAYPGAIMHSKGYRNARAFEGRNVLVIGNAASGTDIAFHISRVCSRLHLSSRTESMFWTGNKADWKEDIDEVVEFLSPKQYNRAVQTKSGRIIEDLDVVIFATGYFYSYPFLSQVEPPIITDGLRIRDTYMDLIHIEHPTLMFPAVSIRIVPFPLGENQASIIARLWSGRLDLPSKHEMRDWEKREIERKGSGSHFHVKSFPEDVAMMNDMYAWAISARRKEGLENDGVGKLGAPWGPPKVWLRSTFIALKMAYIGKGQGRRKIRTIKELGFDYDDWKKDAKPEDMKMFDAARCPSQVVLPGGKIESTVVPTVNGNHG